MRRAHSWARRLGGSAARRLGGSAARRLGGSAARRLGGSAARRLGGSAARRLGGSAARRLGGSADIIDGALSAIVNPPSGVSCGEFPGPAAAPSSTPYPPVSPLMAVSTPRRRFRPMVHARGRRLACPPAQYIVGIPNAPPSQMRARRRCPAAMRSPHSRCPPRPVHSDTPGQRAPARRRCGGAFNGDRYPSDATPRRATVEPTSRLSGPSWMRLERAAGVGRRGQGPVPESPGGPSTGLPVHPPASTGSERSNDAESSLQGGVTTSARGSRPGAPKTRDASSVRDDRRAETHASRAERQGLAAALACAPPGK